MLYMFCADSAFSDVEGNAEALGYMSDKMLNYFYHVTKIMDERSSYLINNKRLVCEPYGGEKAYGQMKLFFDDLRKIPGDVSGPEFTANEVQVIRTLLGETESGSTETVEATAHTNAVLYQSFLFNIIEYCFLQKAANGSPLDAITLNANLTNDTSLFYGYVPGSIKLSSGATTAKIRLGGFSTSLSSNCIYQDYVEFEYKLPDIEKVQIRVYLKGESFLNSYPLSILTKVVYPCNPTFLIDMPYESVQEAISGSAGYSGDMNSEEIRVRDHTGTCIFNTKYACVTKSATYSIPFTIFYKGAMPSASKCREFIRNSILSDYPDIDEAIWNSILPYLFIDAAYYIIPNYAARVPVSGVANERVDLGLTSLPSFISKIQALFPNDNYSFYSQYAAMLVIAGSGLISYCFPESENSEDHVSIMSEVPGYIAVDSYSPYFNYMDEHEKEFALMTARAIKLAQGDPTIAESGEFSRVVIDGKNFISFAVNHVEYYMLMQNSF